MKYKVLIADDEESFRSFLVYTIEMMFAKYYSSLQLQISLAANGLEELTIAQGESQDIIITDINMPKMDGKEAVKKIRLFDKSVPILALTALTETKNVEEIIQCGVSNYVVKPLNKQLFIAQVKSFVNLFLKSGFLYNRKAINLISKQIFKRKMIFDIDRVEDIEEAWEYFLEQNSMLNNKYIQTVLQNIYNLELLIVKNSISNEIILEENEQNYYITISRINQIGNEKINDFLLSHEVDISLIENDESFITFLVSKNKEKTDQQRFIKTNSTDKDFDAIELLQSELEEARELDLRYTTHEKVSAQELAQELDPSIEDKLENFEEEIEALRLRLYDFEEGKNESERESFINSRTI